MPIAVGRTLPLPRPLTDREWGMLVTDLRETFGATGRVGEDGNARYWRNGNLHAFVEPAEGGYRLRLGTVKGNAIALNRIEGADDGDLELQVLRGLGDELAGSLAAEGLRVRVYCPVGGRGAGLADHVRPQLENTSNESFLSAQAAGVPLDELLAAP